MSTNDYIFTIMLGPHFISIICGGLNFMSSRKHLLNTLLILEFIMLSIFWLFIFISIIIYCLLILSFYWLINAHHQFFLYYMSANLWVNSMGYIMILLSLWITVLVFYASQEVLQKNNFPVLFAMTNIALCIALMLAFSSLDLFFFYISFESSLIPTHTQLIGWGYQPERIQAGIYKLFYTLFASLPLLLSFLWL